jgi:ArsR family transcriptional regulator, arsenate/arsenite/antimonite-responsive transcriptional repressor
MESKIAARVLAALAQETRLGIYRMLVLEGGAGLAAGSIGASLKVAPATLSFHLRELAHAGLIHARQESHFIYYSANGSALEKLLEYLTESCRGAGQASQQAKAEALAPTPVAKPVVRPKTRVS